METLTALQVIRNMVGITQVKLDYFQITEKFFIVFSSGHNCTKTTEAATNSTPSLTPNVAAAGGAAPAVAATGGAAPAVAATGAPANKP